MNLCFCNVFYLTINRSIYCGKDLSEFNAKEKQTVLFHALQEACPFFGMIIGTVDILLHFSVLVFQYGSLSLLRAGA